MSVGHFKAKKIIKTLLENFWNHKWNWELHIHYKISKNASLENKYRDSDGRGIKKRQIFRI